MAIPDLKRQLAEAQLGKCCATAFPATYSDQIRLSYKIRGNNITLIASRPAMFQKGTWNDLAIAQFRYRPQQDEWTLCCADRNDRWHLYVDCDPAPELRPLIEEVRDDPTGIFYG